MAPRSPEAQSAPEPAWRFSAEVGGAAPAVWLQGPRIPRVSTGAGAVLGVGARRTLTTTTTATAAFRASVQPVDLKENGRSWNGGTLGEYDVVAGLNFRAPSPRAIDVALETGIGAALLTGAGDILPFSQTGDVVPLGELGVSLTRSSARRDIALVLRYGVLRATAEDAGSPDGAKGAEAGTAGWVGRLGAALRITRQ